MTHAEGRAECNPDTAGDRAEQDDLESKVQDRAVFRGNGVAPRSGAGPVHHPCQGRVGSALSCHSVQYKEILPCRVQGSGSGTNDLGTGVSEYGNNSRADGKLGESGG